MLQRVINPEICFARFQQKQILSDLFLVEANSLIKQAFLRAQRSVQINQLKVFGQVIDQVHCLNEDFVGRNVLEFDLDEVGIVREFDACLRLKGFLSLELELLVVLLHHCIVCQINGVISATNDLAINVLSHCGIFPNLT